MFIWFAISFSFCMCTRENDSNVFCVHETWLSSYNDNWKIRDSRHLHKPAFILHKFPIKIPLSLISYTGCPTTYQTRQFFNNFTTNEDIATKFEADLPHCVRNVTAS